MGMDAGKANANAFDVLSSANARILFGALDAIGGPKIIVWDPTLIKRFNLVATAEQLKQHKVVSMLQLELIPGVPQAEHNHVVYILSANNPAIVNKLIACLRHAHSVNDRRLHHALIVPEASFMIRDTLRQNREANAALRTLDSLPLRLFPLYDDFFTLLMDDLTSKLLLDNDWTKLQKCASSVRQFELLADCLPNLRCRGKWAAQVVEIVKKMRAQDEADSVSEHKDFQISDIILIDRWIDPLTPLLIQLTYAGLIDELLDMGPTGNIKASKVRGNDPGDAATEIPLHDALFRKIRDLHIKDVGKQIAETLGALRDERTRLKENPPSDSLAESKVFVRRLLDMQGSEQHADIHTQIAGRLMNFIRDDLRYSTFPKLAIDIVQGEYGDRIIPQIEDLILETYDPVIVVRFIVLQCLVAGGLKNATINAYERLFVQSYGGYYTSLWIKLQLMGLLWEKSSKVKCDYVPFDFQTLCRRMSCFVDEEHSAHGTTAYPYSGYVPLLVRYIETGVRNGWRDWTTIMSNDQPAIDRNTYSVVFIIGGVTQAELACLRKTPFPNRLLIVASALITAINFTTLHVTTNGTQISCRALMSHESRGCVKYTAFRLKAQPHRIVLFITWSSTTNTLGPMRTICGSFNATVVAAGRPGGTARSSPSTATDYSSPAGPATPSGDDDESSTSGEIEEGRQLAQSSPSFDIVTFRGFLG